MRDKRCSINPRSKGGKLTREWMVWKIEETRHLGTNLQIWQQMMYLLKKTGTFQTKHTSSFLFLIASRLHAYWLAPHTMMVGIPHSVCWPTCHPQTHSELWFPKLLDSSQVNISQLMITARITQANIMPSHRRDFSVFGIHGSPGTNACRYWDTWVYKETQYKLLSVLYWHNIVV